MRTRPGRAFNLLDAIILVAATGAGVALVRTYVITEFRAPAWQPDNYSFRLLADDWSFFRIMKTSVTWVRFPLLIVLAWTPAWLILRYRRPRPRLPLLFRQPGMVACSASMIVAVLLAIAKAAIAICDRNTGDQQLFARSFLDDYSFALQEMAPYVVTTVWVMLALSGRWRGEPSWIDRIGRIIGVFWVGLLPLSWVANAVIGNGFE